MQPQAWFTLVREYVAGLRTHLEEREEDSGHRNEIERLLAVARLVVGIVLALAMISGHGPLHPSSAKVLMGAYAAYTGVVFWATRRRSWSPSRAGHALHASDIVWATVACGLSGGTSSDAYALYAFAIVGAGYRWGLWRSLLDGAVVAVASVVLTVPTMMGLMPWPFEADLFILRTSAVLLLAVLFGTLSERQHTLNRQEAALGRLMSVVGAAPDLTSGLREVFGAFLHLFSARRAFVLVEEFDTRRLFLWKVGGRLGGGVDATRVELHASGRVRWMTPLPDGVHAFWAQRRSPVDSRPMATLALDAFGRLVKREFAVPELLAGLRTWRSLAAVTPGPNDGWHGRLFLIDPVWRPFAETELRYLQTLVRQVSPTLLSLYLMHGVRARIGSRERARVSRELHDGLIQSLVSLEMRLDALSHRAAGVCDDFKPELVEARDILHDEIVTVRELMQHLRPVVADRERLPHELRDLVERFTRTTSIDARLEWAVTSLDLCPRTCREVYRIVQEGLVNVRRHSGASRVTVRVEADAGAWGLIVADNGRGAGFTGSLTHEQLAAESKGPLVIRERVESLGGSLVVESSHEGTRLEMTFPYGQE